MSPIERQRTVGNRAIEAWKPVEPGRVLKVGNRGFQRQMREYGAGLSEIEVVGPDTIEVTIEPVLKRGEVFTFYGVRTRVLSREGINESLEGLQPLGTGIPLIGQKVRWREE